MTGTLSLLCRLDCTFHSYGQGPMRPPFSGKVYKTTLNNNMKYCIIWHRKTKENTVTDKNLARKHSFFYFWLKGFLKLLVLKKSGGEVNLPTPIWEMVLMDLLVRCHRDPCKPELRGPARPDQPGRGGGPVAGQAGQYGRGSALVVQWKG
jgi:hypothetical protein